MYPPLTVVQQCAFASVSYFSLFAPDNGNILFRTWPFSITFFVSVWYGGTQFFFQSFPTIDWFIYHMFCDVFVLYEY